MIIQNPWARFLIFLTTLAVICPGCGERRVSQHQAIPSQPAVSPSGKYRLVIMEGNDGKKQFRTFEIMTNGVRTRVLYSSQEHFRTFDTTYFFWDAEDRVWVYSGDVGTFYWIRLSDADWKKNHYQKQSFDAPPLLKKLKPDRYGP
jgi:hypothetical protein